MRIIVRINYSTWTKLACAGEIVVNGTVYEWTAVNNAGYWTITYTLPPVLLTSQQQTDITTRISDHLRTMFNLEFEIT